MAEQTVDSILVKIKADMSQLRKELNKTNQIVGKSVKDQKKSFSLLGLNFKTLVTGAVAIGAIQVGRSLVSVASAAEEMRGKSSVVFGQFIGEFRNFANELAKDTGRSRVELEAMGASIQDLFVPLGFSREAATGLSKELTKLAVDVGSFNDVADPEVMRAFQSALVGNHEAVRRFGVIISEATLKQELLRMGITKNSNEVDNATKVQARLNLLIAGTADAQGDAIRTADSFANRSRALQSAIKDLSVEVGATLLPSLGDLFNEITKNVVPALREFFKMVGLIDPTRDEKIRELANQLTELRIRFAAVNDKRAMKTISEDIKEVEAELNNLIAIRTKDLELAEEKAKREAELRSQEDKNQITAKQKEFVEGLEDELESLRRLIGAQRGSNEQYEMELALQERLAIVKEQGLDIDSLQGKALEELLRLRQELSKELEKEIEAEEELQDAREEAKSTVDRYKTEQEKLTEEIQKFKDLLEKVGIETVPGAEEALRRMEEELRKLDPVVQILEDHFERAFDGIAQSIADSMTEGKNALESFKSVALNIINSLIKEFLRLQMAQIRATMSGGSGGSFLSGIFGGIGDFFGGMFGGQSGITSSGGTSGNFGAFNTGGPTNFGGGNLVMGGLAGGGSISRGMPTVVGERGAELFIPNNGGRIVNNANTRSMMGNQTVINQNLEVNAGVAQTVRAEMLNLLPAFKAETISAVAESRLRGGEFASAFSGRK